MEQNKLNIPGKVLALNVTEISPKSYWPHNQQNDPWWQNGSSPRPYQWTLTATVTTQSHGSHITRDNFEYNGLDVAVGDWIGGASSGLCVKIISVESKFPRTIEVVVEDYLRYNTFRQPNGVGIFSLGSAVLFSLNSHGEPVLDPLPSGIVSSDFYSTVLSRFQLFNTTRNILLEQADHSFMVGDLVAATDQGFEIVDSDTYKQTIGRVKYLGPAPDQFILEPNRPLVDYVPDVPGERGDTVFVNSQGNLTLSPTGFPAYLVIEPAVPSVIRGANVNPNLNDVVAVEINSSLVLVSGNAESMAANINTATANTGVTARAVTSPSRAVTSSLNLTYGITGGFVPFSANIQGVTVNFTTDTAGQAQFSQAVAIAADMAADINSAGIANVSAESVNGDLVVSDQSGASIIIENVTADARGNNFAGPNSGSGLPLLTPSSTGTQLELERANGGDIIIYDSSEVFERSTGITSSQTGRFTVSIDIHEGLGAASSDVVADLSARNALSPGLGDQAYVLDAGNGKWALYLWNGSNWEEISNQDLAEVNAKTLIVDVAMPQGEDPYSVLAGTLPVGGKIISASFHVDTEFGGGTQPAQARIDIDGVTVVNNDLSDLSRSDVYVATPSYTNTSSSESNVSVVVNHYGATSGEMQVMITYV